MQDNVYLWEACNLKRGEYNNDLSYNGENYWGSEYFIGSQRQCTKCNEFFYDEGKHARICVNGFKTCENDAKEVWGIASTQLILNDVSSVKKYNKYHNNIDKYNNHRTTALSVINIGMLSSIGIVSNIVFNIDIFATIWLSVSLFCALALMCLSIHAFLEKTGILDKINNKSPYHFKAKKAYNTLTPNYHFDDKLEAQDIADELNNAVKNKQPEKIHNILQQIKILDDDAKTHNEKIITENNNKRDSAKNEEKVAVQRRKLNNQVLQNAIQKELATEVIIERDREILQNIFNGEELIKIDKLNQLLINHKNNISNLSQHDKNLLKNCEEEYLSNINIITNLINKKLGVTNGIKEEFMRLVNNCNIILSMITNNILERNNDVITTSNIFLENKYAGLLSDNR